MLRIVSESSFFRVVRPSGLTRSLPLPVQNRMEATDSVKFSGTSARSKWATAALVGLGTLAGLGFWQQVSPTSSPVAPVIKLLMGEKAAQKEQILSAVRKVLNENHQLMQQVRQEVDGKEPEPGSPKFKHYEDLLLNNVRKNVNEAIPLVIQVMQTPEFLKELEALKTTYGDQVATNCKALVQNLKVADVQAFVTNDRLGYMFQNVVSPPSPKEPNYLSRQVECFIEGALRLAKSEEQPEPISQDSQIYGIFVLETLQKYLGITTVE